MSRSRFRCFPTGHWLSAVANDINIRLCMPDANASELSSSSCHSTGFWQPMPAIFGCLRRLGLAAPPDPWLGRASHLPASLSLSFSFSLSRSYIIHPAACRMCAHHSSVSVPVNYASATRSYEIPQRMRSMQIPPRQGASVPWPRMARIPLTPQCDEACPCANCVKRNLACTFERRPPKPRPSPLNQSDQSSDSPGRSLQTDNAIHSFQQPVPDASAFVREWGAQDPELMHHYCIYTSKTMSDRPSIRDVWQIEVPKIAYSYEFLMHGILSLSALHLAYTRPERYSHYLNTSNFHMALGLQTFRIILQTPTKENCRALFCFSSLIMVWTCGAPTDLGDSRPLESVIRLFNLCRGIMTLKPFMSHVESGSLAPLFLKDFRSDPTPPR